MAENTKISGPVEIVTDSSSRVAYDLMEKIAGWEKATDEEKRTREYWLTLFHQCVLATEPYASLESIQKRK